MNAGARDPGSSRGTARAVDHDPSAWSESGDKSWDPAKAAADLGSSSAGGMRLRRTCTRSLEQDPARRDWLEESRAAGRPTKRGPESGRPRATARALRRAAREVGLLPREQQIVLGLFYEEGFKLAEIGAVLGTSEQEARALYSKAVERVRAEAFVPPHRNRQAASRAAARPESSDETVS
jgi:hypothetical protein